MKASGALAGAPFGGGTEPNRNFTGAPSGFQARPKRRQGGSFSGRVNESLSDRTYSRRFSETLSPAIWPPMIVLFLF
jgi:hypothetical protein